MKHIDKLLSAFLFFSSTLSAQTWTWAVKVGSTGVSNNVSSAVSVESMADAGSGGLYYTGNFAGDVLFGGTTTLGTSTTSNSYDAYIARFDQNGGFLWAHQFPGLNLSYGSGNSVASDFAGSAYVAGSFNGAAIFDSDTLRSAGNNSFSDGFLAKVNFSNYVVWSKRIGGKKNDGVNSVIANGSGDIYITGIFSDTAWFDNNYVVASGQSDFFVAKYDFSGNNVWVQHGGASSSYCQGTGIELDPGGNVYVIGNFTNQMSFSNSATTITSAGSSDLFAAKYTSSGSLVWARDIGNAAAAPNVKNIRCDGAGNFFFTGYFTDSTKFGSTTLVASQYEDGFLAKYDSYGQFVWVRQITGPGGNICKDLDVVQGCPIITGVSEYGDAQFGSYTLPVLSTSYAPFIAKYDMGGNFLWAVKGDETNGGAWGDVITANQYECYIAGDMVYTMAFGSHYLSTSSWGSDVYTAHLFDASAGVHEENANQFFMYPVPATTDLTIIPKSGEEKITAIKLLNALGQEVNCPVQFISNQMAQVNISALPEGMYSVMIVTKNGMTTQKFLKQ